MSSVPATSIAGIDYRPRVPDDPQLRGGIGIIGCGNIVRNAHLPAYRRYGLPVVGVYDVDPAAVTAARAQGDVGAVFNDVDSMLADPRVHCVDIATHPLARLPLIRAAVRAGKHVLSQKPLAESLGDAREIVALAEKHNVTVAVNQNGRWAPSLRIATLLIERGAIGEVTAVTHLFDHSNAWIVGTPFDEIPHWALFDYAVHWFDMTRCWMAAHRPTAVRAREFRPAGQDRGRQPWAFNAEICYETGAHVTITDVGNSTTSRPSHRFWIHGSSGVIRGSALGEDFVEIERDGATTRYALEGAWFPDGFAGTMGELMCAVAERREPFNSARHNLLSLEMTLAACRSAERDGEAVEIEGERA